MRGQIVIFSFLVFVDQLLKYFFSFWSMGTSFFGQPVGFYLFREDKIIGWLPSDYFWVTILVLVYLGVAITIYRDNELRDRSGLALVFLLSGMAGNLIDRVFLGYVRDYINIGDIVFNLADVMILTGIVILMIKYKNVRATRL